MSGLQKFDSKQIRSRASSPRLMVHDPSLMSAMWRGAGDLLADPSLRGHLVETAVGARLIARSALEGFDLYWWRDGNLEVDFVAKRGDGALAAIEVKSGRVSKSGMGSSSSSTLTQSQWLSATGTSPWRISFEMRSNCSSIVIFMGPPFGRTSR